MILHPQWTAERITELKVRWAAQEPASFICLEMGITRNAVLGKIHRLGLSVSHSEVQERHRKRREERLKNGWVPSGKKGNIRPTTRDDRKKPKFALTRGTDLPSDKSDFAVKFRGLKQYHCRWPLYGEPPEMFFCGAEKLRGYSYCERHCRVAYIT